VAPWGWCVADKIRVLIVDDHDRVRGGLVTALRRADPLEVVGATGCADEALQWLHERSPDVILLEVKRVDGAGLELCRQLSHNATEHAVVVLTSYLSPQEWSGARDAGAKDYALKQIDSKGLVAKIAQVADRNRNNRS